jgi:hypothetical protein
MRFAALIGGLLLAAILVRLFGANDHEQLLARIDALEARTAGLAAQLTHLEQASTPPPQAEAQASAAGPIKVSAGWRLSPGLGGDPISIVEKTFDERSGRVEALLRIEAPLSDIDAWPRLPGQPVPIQLEARDTGGAIALSQPMTLLRGTSLEPGAYLHIGANLPPRVASRVGFMELRRTATESRAETQRAPTATQAPRQTGAQ